MSDATESDSAEQQFPFADYVEEADWDGAKRRAAFARDRDPFPRRAPALLSSEHIQEYVKHTAMIHPFYPNSERLKPASYEVYPGKKIIYWDDKDQVNVDTISKDGKYKLRANSITFLQIESRLQLPNYIAAIISE